MIDETIHLIQQAGNADSEEARLDLLRQLRSRPELGERLQNDLDRLIREVERWNNDKAFDYFGSQVSRTRDYAFGIGADSALYPLTYLYRGRMVTWYALESGSVWKILPQKISFLDVARGFFEKAAAAFPENKIARMYLGEPIAAQKQYPAVAGAPDWAVYQREGLERLADIIEWWIEHRMRGWPVRRRLGRRLRDVALVDADSDRLRESDDQRGPGEVLAGDHVPGAHEAGVYDSHVGRGTYRRGFGGRDHGDDAHRRRQSGLE